MADPRIEWIIFQHSKTNHFYDTYLPYEFHLRMVVKVCQEFNHLEEKIWHDVELACWGHDLIEDCRVSYNDCKKMLGEDVAEIIYAVTNEKGKTRSERANGKYYKEMAQVPGAVFVKLCDRIANVQYSKMTKSPMFEMYKKENSDFVFSLTHTNLDPMIKYLNSLFE